jgi:hypothetical protein
MRKKYLELIYEGTIIIKVLKAWLQGEVGFRVYGLNLCEKKNLRHLN